MGWPWKILLRGGGCVDGKGRHVITGTASARLQGGHRPGLLCDSLEDTGGAETA